MVAVRFGVAAILVIWLAGCSGQPPARPTTNSTSPSTAKDPSVEKPDSQRDKADASGDVASAPAKTETTPSSEPAKPEPPFHLEERFEMLSFSDFEAFGAEAGTWEGTDEGVKCAGKPNGYLYSKQPYQNFTMRLDYRFPRPESLKDDSKFKGNTGFLVYVTGEHKVWPVCLEVQGKFVQMGAIKENGGAQPVTATDDDAARQKARRPVGQWNSLEVVSMNGALTVSLNGAQVSKCDPDFLSEGLIGIQAEGHPFEVRRLRIRRD